MRVPLPKAVELLPLAKTLLFPQAVLFGPVANARPQAVESLPMALPLLHATAFVFVANAPAPNAVE